MPIKKLYPIVALLLANLFFANRSTGQVIVSPSFSVLKSTSNDKPVLIGGGLQVGYAITSHLQLGLAYNIYATKNRDRQFDNLKTIYKDQASNFAIAANYFFLDSTSTIRPLVGADAGINLAKQTIYLLNVTTNTPERPKSVHNILLSPKLGVAIRINKWLSIIPQAQYHFSVQKKKEDFIGYTSAGIPITLSPIQSFYTLSASIAIRF